MKVTRVGQLLVIGCVVAALSGCATMRKKENPETLTLKTQISDMEGQLRQKDSEIDSLRKALAQTTEDKYNAAKMNRGSGESAAVPSATQIQTALKNAGYKVEVDGKIGRGTRSVIKEFQKANGLEPDGKVGKKTWTALEPFLNKQ
jgi:murein L,D-transpeptidase YcbB/YkuD